MTKHDDAVEAAKELYDRVGTTSLGMISIIVEDIRQHLQVLQSESTNEYTCAITWSSQRAIDQIEELCKAMTGRPT